MEAKAVRPLPRDLRGYCQKSVLKLRKAQPDTNGTVIKMNMAGILEPERLISGLSMGGGGENMSQNEGGMEIKQTFQGGCWLPADPIEPFPQYP